MVGSGEAMSKSDPPLPRSAWARTGFSGAGSWAGSAVAAGALDARPDVRVPEGAVPAVVVSDDVETVIGDQADEHAAQMADDLVEALMIEASAAAAGDVDVAAWAWWCGRGVETCPSLVISKLEPRSKNKH